MAAQRASRLKKELERLRKDPPHGVTCWSKEDRVDSLQAQLLGAEGTPYEGGIFSLDIRIPDRYPFQPPQVQFVTPIYHPNVDNAGRICLDVLKSQPQGSWKPAHNLSTVLTSIQLLLSEPNPDDGLMADISHEYKHNHPQFLEKAKMWVKQHASGATGDSDIKIKGKKEDGSGNQSRKRKVPPEIGGDSEREEDEIETLQAIYGDDFRLVSTAGSGSNVYSITISSPDCQCINVQITCPTGYPTTASPIYELRNSEWLDSTHIVQIAEQLTQVFKDHEGEVVVYQLIECIRDYLTTTLNVSEEPGNPVVTIAGGSYLAADDNGSVEPNKSSGANPEGSKLCGEQQCPDIVHSEPLTDRKSTFQAHAAKVHSKQEVLSVVTELKQNKKVASATHNILAYRLLDSTKGVLVQDCDDDGESSAGGRLLHLLQMMDVKNAVVVVSRWYGGIQLHGDRFKHINNVARILLQETGIGLEVMVKHTKRLALPGYREQKERE